MRAGAVVTGRFTPGERAAAWTALMLLGGLQAFVFADRLNPDGIAYLDVAEAWARGDWGAAVNPYWSPALSWILALAGRPLDLVGCDGLARIHVLLALFYAFALWGWERLILALDDGDAGPDARLRGWRWFTYALFGMVSLRMIGLVWLTPDLLLLGLTCLAAAAGLRTLRADASRGTAVGFGAALGAAYWTKAAFFPLALVFLATAGLLGRSVRSRGIARAAAAFAVTASLWIVPLSLHEGRPTFGDAGRLNAAWFLGTARPYTHWTGGGGSGTPDHPLLRADGFDAFAFPEPFTKATYPPWYAPSHWYRGVRLRLEPSRVAANAEEGLRALASSPPLPYAVASVLALWSLAMPRRRRDLRPAPLLLVVPGLVGLGAYVLLHVELRLLAPVLLLAWTGLLAMPRVRPAARRSWSAAGGLAFAALMALPLLRDSSRQVEWLRAGVTPGRDQDCAIAGELATAGLERGTRIAVVGDASAAAWAWIGGLRIVGDVPDPAEFWSASPGVRSSVTRFLADAGAEALFAPSPSPERPIPEGWRRLGETGGLVLDLTTSAGPDPASSAGAGPGDAPRENVSGDGGSDEEQEQ